WFGVIHGVDLRVCPGVLTTPGDDGGRRQVVQRLAVGGGGVVIIVNVGRSSAGWMWLAQMVAGWASRLVTLCIRVVIVGALARGLAEGFIGALDGGDGAGAFGGCRARSPASNFKQAAPLAGAG